MTSGTVPNGVNGASKETFLFTSESVGEGHPDKIAYVLFHESSMTRQLISNTVTRSPTLSLMPASRSTPSPELPARQPPRLVSKPSRT
jgi:hypothetical protein